MLIVIDLHGDFFVRYSLSVMQSGFIIVLALNMH